MRMSESSATRTQPWLTEPLAAAAGVPAVDRDDGLLTAEDRHLRGCWS